MQSRYYLRRRSRSSYVFFTGTRPDKPRDLCDWTLYHDQASVADEPGSMCAMGADHHPTRAKTTALELVHDKS